MLWQRQVKRLDESIYGTERQADAMRQISSAWVLHVDTMCDFLRFTTKRILQLQCAVCGHRHFFHTYYSPLYPEGWTYMHCDNGWWFSVRTIFKGAKFHLLHGRD